MIALQLKKHDIKFRMSNNHELNAMYEHVSMQTDACAPADPCARSYARDPPALAILL